MLLYIHGAFGYIVNDLFDPGLDVDTAALQEQVMAGGPIKLELFHRVCTEAANRQPCFEFHLMKGLCDALAASAPNIQSVMIKAKANKKLNLKPAVVQDLELSWVSAGVAFGFGSDTASAPVAHDTWPADVFRVGVTGLIAAGKSTLLRELEREGAHVINADKLGHLAYAPGTEGFRLVVDEFGDDIVGADGAIDRKVLGSKVRDPERRKTLEAIVWPQIAAKIDDETRRICEERQNTKLPVPTDSSTADNTALPTSEVDFSRVIILEAAVLHKAGWSDRVDEVWTISVDKDVAVKRVMERDSCDESRALSILDMQMSNSELVAKADRVLENNANDNGVQLVSNAKALLTSILSSGATK